MKLKSAVKVTDSKLHPHTYVAGSLRDVEHDAACAHALMLAIEDRVQRAEENNHLQEQVTLRGIKRFADELMREWGFDSTPEQAE